LEPEVKGSSAKWIYIVSILSALATLFMAVAVVYFYEFVRALAQYGYVGAFMISILGGATIIVPATTGCGEYCACWARHFSRRLLISTLP